MKKFVARPLMESSAASGVICLQFSTAPQPKVNRLWDLLEKASPFCRTYWIATGWAAWRDNEQAQADQVPVIPRINRSASRPCPSRQPGWNHPSPALTPLGGARGAQTPTQKHSPRQSEATALLQTETGSEGARHKALGPWSHSCNHKAAWAEHNSPLPHTNNAPKPANVSN